jgi:hypothetical protein
MKITKPWLQLLGLSVVALLIYSAMGIPAAEAQQTIPATPISQPVRPQSGTLLQNGSFESGLTGWTVMNGNGVTGNVAEGSSNATAPDSVFPGQTNDFIDLGVDSLGGCVTQDTVDYAGIWTRSANFGSVPVWNSTNGAKPVNDHDAINSTYSSKVEVVTAISGGPVITAGSSAVFMQLGSHWRLTGYHVLHGPAIVSDPFSATSGQVVNLEWYSAAGADDFAVLGYLLDTTTCTQYEVIDQTGTSASGWQFVSATIPVTSSAYRFIFVNGTFDKTGGKKSGASFWVDNISVGNPQTIDFSLTGITKNYHVAGGTSDPFTLPGTATSGLPLGYVSLTPSKCTVEGSTVTIVGSGTCTITATQGGGLDSNGVNWATAAPVTSSFNITNTAPTATPSNTRTSTPTATATNTPTPTPSPQTITFPAIADQAAGTTSFAVAATASSGLAVTFTSASPSICTVSGTTVTVVTPGACRITAAQAGGTNSGTTYTAATSVTNTINIKSTQTVTFPAIAPRPVATTSFAVAATASSGLPVTYTSSTPSVCTVSGTTVTRVGPGTCTLTATQAGGTSGGIVYESATASQDILLNYPQTITFPSIANQPSTTTSFTVAATASSTMDVSYTSSTPMICAVEGTTVTVYSPGKCTIKASQAGGLNDAGDKSYDAAADVSRDINIMSAQTINFPPIAAQAPNATTFPLSATTSSGLPIVYTVMTPTVCSVSGTTVTKIASGTCTIKASAGAGTLNGIMYEAATDVVRDVSLNAAQVITFPAMGIQSVGTTSIKLSGVSSAGFPVTYTSSTPSVCTVSGNVVTVVTPGKCTLTASAAGGTKNGVTYENAGDVTRDVHIKSPQTITFPTVDPSTTGNNTFALPATASSGLPVRYTTTSSQWCSVSGNIVTVLMRPGNCVVTAAQPGGTNPATNIIYDPAPTVPQTIVLRAGQRINFPGYPEQPAGTQTVALAAVSSAGLPVTYATTTPSICTVSGTTVTVLGPGTCSVTASAAGGIKNGATFDAAPDVTRDIVIRDRQTITMADLSDVQIDAPDIDPGATASSTLPVTYVSQTPLVCTIVAGKVKPVGMGTCRVTATQPGGRINDMSYDAAAPVSKSFVVTGMPQTITFPALSDQRIELPAPPLAATASSGLAVTYASLTPTVCTVTNGVLRLVTGGTCSIQASQRGGNNGGILYGAAANVINSFVVDNATMTPTVTPTNVPAALLKSAVGNLWVLGLLQNKTLVMWGKNDPGVNQSTIPLALRGLQFDDIAASVGTAYALDTSGNLYAWGDNLYGERNIPVNARTGVKAVAAGARFAFAVLNDGSVVAWGRNDFGQTNLPAGLTNVIAVDGGDRHAVALKADGTVIAWGDNLRGQASVPPGLSGVIAVSAGENHTLALLNNGQIVGWGANTAGQLSIPTSKIVNVVAIAAGRESSLAVTADGNLVAWGNRRYITFKGNYSGKVYSVDSDNQNSIMGLRDGGVLVAGNNLSNVFVSRTRTLTPSQTRTATATRTPTP